MTKSEEKLKLLADFLEKHSITIVKTANTPNKLALNIQLGGYEYDDFEFEEEINETMIRDKDYELVYSHRN